MTTTGEYEVYLTIWSLTLAGAFFWGRAACGAGGGNAGKSGKAEGTLARHLRISGVVARSRYKRPRISRCRLEERVLPS